jgi:phosphoglycerate kinase
MNRNSLPLITDRNDLRGKRVLVRASLDVPLEDGKVLNFFRVMRAIPTLLYLSNAGARVVVVAHIGREPDMSLLPVFEVLKEHLPVTWVSSVVGNEVEHAINNMQDGDVVLLENLRSEPEEVANDEEFAKTLASYADIYVNDAFANSHREHASMVGVPRFLQGYFGITFQEEYSNLVTAMDPVSPSLFILGGAKFETKEPLIEKYINRYDHVFVGGALANDFFKAQGHEVGESLVSEESIGGSELVGHKKLLLPIDVTVQSENGVRVTKPEDVQKGESIHDAGPETVRMLTDYVQSASTILWNGPIGYYEHGFARETEELARVVAESNARSIVGGGDTVAAIESLGLNDKFSFVSSAGGAMLTFLECATLPAIEAVLASQTNRN